MDIDGDHTFDVDANDVFANDVEEVINGEDAFDDIEPPVDAGDEANAVLLLQGRTGTG